MFGLLDRDIENICDALKKFKEVEKAIIFGSRAMGNYKKGSDIDLAIVGQHITPEIIYKLDDYLNEIYPIPYFFDVIHYDSVTNENLKKHIENEGKLFYHRSA
jgi:uncharacterized protein